MITKIIYAFRIITICLFALFALDYFFKWGLSKNLFIVICLLLIAYIITSLIMVFTQVKQKGFKPPDITLHQHDKTS